ncbi:glycerate kinase [Anabrus simplex]|uniref:glycerate kinase n=1 Tax=Anabrus simplex TaxID=316456 RepID=UPI0035A301DC
MINCTCLTSHIFRQRSWCVLSKMSSNSNSFTTRQVSTGEHNPQPSPSEFNSQTSTGGLRRVHYIKEDLMSIFNAAVSSVLPHQLIRNTLKVSGQTLQVGNEEYVLKKNCYVVGFGKAVLGMSVETENILHEHLVSGVISIPVGMRETFANSSYMQPRKHSVIEIMEGAKDNLPDEMAFEAAKKIANLVENLDEKALLIVLCSGGGSALLPYPKTPVTLAEKVKVCNLLVSRGANIKELNCVRKRLSLLKGGGLGKLAHPARVVTLILSDIVGDPLDFIASGPTVINTDPPHKAKDIIRRYNLDGFMPASVNEVLNSPYPKDVKLPLEAADLDHIQNVIVGDNTIAVDAAKGEAVKRGYEPVVLSTKIQASVTIVNQMYVSLSVLICKYLSGLISELDFRELVNAFSAVLEPELQNKLVLAILNFDNSKGICLIGGGETTVSVTGKGRGGRNQELALSFTTQMYIAATLHPFLQNYSVVMLSAGTDGIDGPTDAAGAFGYQEQYEAAKQEAISPRKFLENNGSYDFYSKFRNGEDLVKIGHTGTNVMDLHFIVIQKLR